MMNATTERETSAVEFRLTAMDRCDSCGAQAYMPPRSTAPNSSSAHTTDASTKRSSAASQRAGTTRPLA